MGVSELSKAAVNLLKYYHHPLFNPHVATLQTALKEDDCNFDVTMYILSNPIIN